VDVIVGTLGEALGSYGAFAACDRLVTQYLLQAVRTLVFSTAPAPPAVAGALAALVLLEERPRLVEKLRVNAAALRDGLEAEGFDLRGSRTHIVAFEVGEPEIALRLCDGALTRGVFAQPVFPPATPVAGSCVRMVVMASHRREELRAAAAVIAQAARAVGFDPRETITPIEEPYETYAVEPPEAYDVEPPEPYEDVDPSVPYDFEQIPRAA
jgi:glycine C-acetyltransferase/8-amino-7-oxononanoate synthase